MTIPIPQDIFDEVISYLRVHSDRDTLHSCSVVSHSFFIPARRKLFYAITLENARAAQALYNLLKLNHVSAYYIGELYIDTSIWNYKFNEMVLWFEKDQVLPKILELTQCLTLISLKPDTITDWSSISVELRSALVKQFQLPTLTEARIHSIRDFPSTVITNSSHLRKLVLNTVYFTPPSADVVSIPGLVHLEQLELDGETRNVLLSESGMRNIRLLSTRSFSSLSPVRELIQFERLIVDGGL